MNILFYKSQEFFTPQTLWQNAPERTKASARSAEEEKKALETKTTSDLNNLKFEVENGQKKLKNDSEVTIVKAEDMFSPEETTEIVSNMPETGDTDADTPNTEEGKSAPAEEAKTNQEKNPENFSVTKEERDAFKTDILSTNKKINALIEKAKELSADPNISESEKQNIAQNAEDLVELNAQLAALGNGVKNQETFAKSKATLASIDENITALSHEKNEALMASKIKYLAESKMQLDRQYKRSGSAIKFLLHRMPGIREIVSDESTTSQTLLLEYKEALAEDLNAWAKTARREFVQSKKKESWKSQEFSPFVEAFFTNIPNGANLKQRLINQIKNPEGGIEQPNYFETLGFDANVDTFFAEKSENVAAILFDEDYSAIDQNVQEGAEYLFEGVVEAKAAGASKEMRAEYVNFLKKNAYMSFQEWLDSPNQKKKYGTIDRIAMTINKFIDKLGPLLSIFGLNFEGGLTGYTDDEKKLKSVADDAPLEGEEETLRTKYKKRTVSENLRNFSTLNDTEKTDLWDKIKAGSDPMNPEGPKMTKEDQEKNIDQYWTQYGKGAKENLKTAHTSYGEAVDFLDQKNPEKILSPQDFEAFYAEAQNAPYKDFLDFGAEKTDGEYALSSAEWESFLNAVPEGVEAAKDGEKLVFTLEGAEKPVELYDWKRESIGECIKALKKLIKNKSGEGSSEKKETWSWDGTLDFVKDNPAEVGAGGSVLTGLLAGAVTQSWNPVGWGLGIGALGYAGYLAYNKWIKEEKSQEKNESEDIPQEDQNISAANTDIPEEPPQ